MNEIDDYLAPYPPEIRAVAQELRAIIKDAIPGVSEKLVRGWQLIGYRAPSGSGSRYFCFIAPYSDRVRLGFEWGVLMADEDNRLQDGGTQVRSLYISDSAELQTDRLKRTIRESAEVALLSKEQKAGLALHRAAEREQQRTD